MNSELSIAIALCFAAALFCAAQALYWLWRRRAHRAQEVLRLRLRGRSEQLVEDGIHIRELGKGAGANAQFARFASYCVQAGFRAEPAQVALRIAIAAVLGSVFGVLALGGAAGLLSGAGAVLALAYGYMSIRRDRRIKAFANQLPRALEAMVFALRAGRGLEDAIGLAAEEVDAPLAAELSRVFEETALGKPVEQSLVQLGQRWHRVRSLRSFVEAVSVLKRTGGNLVVVMHNISDAIRARAAYEARHRALTSEGRTSGRILVVLPLLALVVQAIVTPDQLRVLLSSEGQPFFFGAMGLWLIGMLWVSRLSRPVGG